MSVFDDNEILKDADNSRWGELIMEFNNIHGYRRHKMADFTTKSKKTKIFDMIGNIVSVGDFVIISPRDGVGSSPSIAKVMGITPKQMYVREINKIDDLKNENGGYFNRVYANTVIKIDAEQLSNIINNFINNGIVQ